VSARELSLPRPIFQNPSSVRCSVQSVGSREALRINVLALSCCGWRSGVKEDGSTLWTGSIPSLGLIFFGMSVIAVIFPAIVHLACRGDHPPDIPSIVLDSAAVAGEALHPKNPKKLYFTFVK
jgi:hypothetical protein